jgi:branched-chain amino acid transport system ATP-binding protein
MHDPLLRVDGLVKRFGGLIAISDLTLDIRPDELHAVIGPNGAGKTTLVLQIAGELTQDSGTIHFANSEISRLSAPARIKRGLGRTFQITQLLNDYSALDNVALAVQARSGHSFRFWSDARKDQGLRSSAARFLERVGLDNRGNVPVGEMSHGEQKQLELAIALATGPRLLLLDEPMAGLGAAESAHMIDLLRRLKGEVAILLIEHDMDAVFALADRVSVLVNGQCIATGTSDVIRGNETVRVAYLGENDL